MTPPIIVRVTIIEFADFIDKLETSIRESVLPVIVADDFNAKSGHWGSIKEDARGVLLTDWMASLNLAVCNKGNKPTFVRGNSESHIDITFASNSIVNSITNWRILEKESPGIHQYITFDIAANSGEKHHQKSGPRWSWRKRDDNKLKAFIETRLKRQIMRVRGPKNW